MEKRSTEEIMREKGYITPKRVAEITGWARSTVYEKVSSEEVSSVQIAGKTFVEVKSLVGHIGIEGARVLGIVK